LDNIDTMNQVAQNNQARKNFGPAWFLLCLALGANIWDEAAHGFLEYYNATVLTLWAHFPWFPKIDVEFRPWLLGVSGVAIVLLLLTPFAHGNAR
jgi:NADH:ubiquinone oxidoreductase subunit 4 (subunit M)